MRRETGSPFDMISGILDRIFSVIGALLLAQFPQYYSQYIQRLSGHVQEAKITLQRYIQAAQSLGLTLQEYVDHHLVSQEEIYTSSGEVILQIVDRFYLLENSLQVLNNATPLNRWFIFIRQVDWEIAKHTWQGFTPGVPTTPEGIIYALMGLFLGWGIFQLIRGLFQRLFFRKRVNFKF